MEPETRGDPVQPLVWTAKPTGHLAGELGRAGWPVSADTVGRRLKDRLGYGLQGGAKTLEGGQRPGRGAQFGYINDLVTGCLAAGIPVISIDCRQKELAGDFKNGGAEGEPEGSPRRVNDHGFAGKELGKVAPYGIYDLAANAGWVNVGTGHETAAFAVESIRRWWKSAGAQACPGARQLLITAGCGGSNGSRRRLWKVELAKLATGPGIEITVVHLPAGASKWNKIGHRLFSAISVNWRGRPLESHQVILETIRATTTRTGPRVQAELDTGSYPTGIEVSNKQMKDLTAQVITPHEFHGEWNYSIAPGYLGLDHDTPDIT